MPYVYLLYKTKILTKKMNEENKNWKTKIKYEILFLIQVIKWKNKLKIRQLNFFANLLLSQCSSNNSMKFSKF